MNMKGILVSMVAASALILAANAQADADLAKNSGCLNCHTVETKLVGPSLKEIAAKLFDAEVKHEEKMLALKKDAKDKKIERFTSDIAKMLLKRLKKMGKRERPEKRKDKDGAEEPEKGPATKEKEVF